MNELGFLEVIGKIDDDIVREADTDYARPHRRIAAAAPIAAALLLLLALPLLHGRNAADMLGTPGQEPVNAEPVPAGTTEPEGADETAPEKETETAAEREAEEETADTKTAAEGTSAGESIQPASAGNAPAVQQTAEAGQSGGRVQNTAPAVTGRAERTTAPQTAAPSKTTSAAATEPAAAAQPTENKGGTDITGCSWSPFRGTKDPDTDSFGDDEIHHVDIRTADGFYRQLSPDEYAGQGVAGEVRLSDFGGYIGKAVEVENNSEYHGGGAETQEPALAGADVYYYAPSGSSRALIIVKKGTQCSIFISDVISTGGGFRKGFAFFGVQSADNIQSIDCCIRVPEGGLMVTAVQETITDCERIAAVFDVLCSLEPEDYSQLPAHTGTPQWLVDAWQRYDSDPNAPQRTDYGITLRFTDGTEPQEIQFQPYLGSGYVEGMKELTPEQNAALRTALGQN